MRQINCPYLPERPDEIRASGDDLIVIYIRNGNSVAELEPDLVSDLSLTRHCIEHVEREDARNGYPL
jgi:hypothetical protein